MARKAYFSSSLAKYLVPTDGVWVGIPNFGEADEINFYFKETMEKIRST